MYTIYFFIKVFNENFTYYFVEDLSSLIRGTDQFHENLAITDSNNSTVTVQSL